MAQTKRKRRSKHRGTAAGSIQARGRTSRPASAKEQKQLTRAQARERRLSSPPTWKSSLTRASFAAVLMFLFLVFTTKGKDRVLIAVVPALAALILYVPAGYYLELWMFRRRQKRQGRSR